jgi:hypothetical protein
MYECCALLQHKIRVGAPELDKLPQRDPTLIATAYKKQRLYLFTRREPADAEDATVSGFRVRV